jgi:hypothetical protein
MRKTFTIIGALLLLATASQITRAQENPQKTEAYLSWNAAQIETIGKQFREKGKVGSSFTLRGLNTQRAINYKLRATIFTPELIRASARFQQLRGRLSDKQTMELVAEAEAIDGLVVMIELDPNEGSGVIPLDWQVFLQPKGLGAGESGAIPGIKSQKLRSIKGLSGVFRRKYDYDLFMVVFPLVDDNQVALLSPEIGEIEILVGIDNSEGRVSWRMPDSLRRRIETLSSKQNRGEQNEN